MKFDNITEIRKQSIRRNYKLPIDTSKVTVNTFGQPFEIIKGKKVICTLIPMVIQGEGFHNYNRKQK